MAIRAGQIIHVGNDQVVIDRIQTAGPGTVNVPTETVFELGNYKSVAQIRDIPDLSFSLESYDVSTEIEALLLGVDPTDAGLYPYDLQKAHTINMKSVFKAGKNASDPFVAVGSVGLPFLSVESVSYKFGISSDASQTVGLRGDSIFYNPGSTYVEEAAGTNAANQVIVSAQPAYLVTEGGISRRIIDVSVDDERLVYQVDWTESYGTVTAHAAVTTLTILKAVPTTSKIKIMYSSPTAEEYLQTVHALATVKPAAIRGRDIDVYLGGYDPAFPGTNRMRGVQAITLDWKVTLDKDLEFGNYHVVAQDFDVPTVNGTIQVKPVDPAAFIALMQQISGVDPTTLASATATAAPLIQLDIVLRNPADGSTLKHFSVDDARFSVPGFSAKVQQKLDTTITWNSDRGDLTIDKV